MKLRNSWEITLNNIEITLLPLGVALKLGLLTWKIDVLALNEECTTPLNWTLTLQEVALILGDVEKNVGGLIGNLNLCYRNGKTY